MYFPKSFNNKSYNKDMISSDSSTYDMFTSDSDTSQSKVFNTDTDNTNIDDQIVSNLNDTPIFNGFLNYKYFLEKLYNIKNIYDGYNYVIKNELTVLENRRILTLCWKAYIYNVDNIPNIVFKYYIKLFNDSWKQLFSIYVKKENTTSDELLLKLHEFDIHYTLFRIFNLLITTVKLKTIADIDHVIYNELFKIISKEL